MAKEKRKTTRSKPSQRVKQTPKKIEGLNPDLQWSAYLELEKQINTAWATLQDNVQKKAGAHTLLEDRNRLMLLLAECNYLARECSHWAGKSPTSKKTPRKRSR